MRTPQFPTSTNHSPSIECRALLKTAEHFEELFALQNATSHETEANERINGEKGEEKPREEVLESEPPTQKAVVERQCDEFRRARLAVAHTVAQALHSADRRAGYRGAGHLNQSPSVPTLRGKPMLPVAACRGRATHGLPHGVPHGTQGTPRPRSAGKTPPRKVSSPRSPSHPIESSRTPSASEARLRARMQRVDQLTPRSQAEGRSLTPQRSRQDSDLSLSPREVPPVQERSKAAGKQVFLKTMGLEPEEFQRCQGSLAAQATILLQRQREARQVAQLAHLGSRREPRRVSHSLPRNPSVPRSAAPAARQRLVAQEPSSQSSQSASQPEALSERCERYIVHEKAPANTGGSGKLMAVDDVLLGLGRRHKPETTEEVNLAGDDAKEKDEDTDTVPMPGFTLNISRLPSEATDASLRKMCHCFGLQVVRVRRPSCYEAEVLLGPSVEPERSRRTRLFAGFLESRAGCQVNVCGGLPLGAFA